MRGRADRAQWTGDRTDPGDLGTTNARSTRLTNVLS